MAWFKEGVKAGLKTLKEWAPGLARWGGDSAKGVVKFGLKHPVVGAVAVGAYAQKDGEGVLNFWGRKFGGSDFTDKGVGAKAKELAFGKGAEDKSALGAGYDFIAGDGAAEKLGNQIAELGDKVQEKFGDARDAIKEQLHGSDIQEAGMQQPGFDNSYLRYANYPLNTMADNGQLGYGSYGGQNNNGGFFGNIKNFISNLFGNKDATMGTAAVAAAAWLLFGRFGWLGKVGGVLAGYWGLNNMKSGLTQTYAQQMGMGMGIQGQRPMTAEEMYRLQEMRQRELDERAATVDRGRGEERNNGLKLI